MPAACPSLSVLHASTNARTPVPDSYCVQLEQGLSRAGCEATWTKFITPPCPSWYLFFYFFIYMHHPTVSKLLLFFFANQLENTSF